jgi:hypothetical protein
VQHHDVIPPVVLYGLPEQRGQFIVQAAVAPPLDVQAGRQEHRERHEDECLDHQ